MEQIDSNTNITSNESDLNDSSSRSTSSASIMTLTYGKDLWDCLTLIQENSNQRYGFNK